MRYSELFAGLMPVMWWWIAAQYRFNDPMDGSVMIPLGGVAYIASIGIVAWALVQAWRSWRRRRAVPGAEAAVATLAVAVLGAFGWLIIPLLAKFAAV